MAGDATLKMVDSLIAMMNSIVVQFSMKQDKEPEGHSIYDSYRRTTAPLMLCEKAVLGFCALHHLLLYQQHKERSVVTSLVECNVDDAVSIAVIIHSL